MDKFHFVPINVSQTAISKNKMPLVPMSVAVPADLRVWIGKLADHYGFTPSQMTRALLMDYFEMCGGRFGRFTTPHSFERDNAMRQATRKRPAKAAPAPKGAPAPEPDDFDPSVPGQPDEGDDWGSDDDE